MRILKLKITYSIYPIRRFLLVGVTTSKDTKLSGTIHKPLKKLYIN